MKCVTIYHACCMLCQPSCECQSVVSCDTCLCEKGNPWSEAHTCSAACEHMWCECAWKWVKRNNWCIKKKKKKKQSFRAIARYSQFKAILWRHALLKDKQIQTRFFTESHVSLYTYETQGPPWAHCSGVSCQKWHPYLFFFTTIYIR